MNGVAFRTYVEQVSMPTFSPDEIVAMDNLPAHKAKGMRAAIEAAGAFLRFLPPDSPDFNPIKIAFSEPKTLVRARANRTVEALRQAVGTLCLPAKCADYFNADGYDAHRSEHNLAGRRCSRCSSDSMVGRVLYPGS